MNAQKYNKDAHAGCAEGRWDGFFPFIMEASEIKCSKRVRKEEGIHHAI